MAQLYCYENGSCRGEPFSTRVILDVEQVLNILGLALLAEDAEGVDDVITEQAQLLGKNWNFQEVIFCLFSGESWMGYGDDEEDEDVRGTRERMDKILRGVRFSIEQEESTWGFGSTADEAKLAYAESESAQEEDDWTEL